MPVKMKRSTVTAELLEQDESIFVSRNSHQKGLQQYFTPLKIAECIFNSLSFSTGCVIDLTAGNGNLLQPFVDDGDPETVTLGIELDKGNIPKPTEQMRIVNANLPELYPFLLSVDFRPNVVVLNPPFSLFWKSPELTGSDDKSIESQEATILMGINLLASNGHGAFLVQKTSWQNSLSKVDEINDRVYMAATIRNAFLPHSKVETVLCFFAKKKVYADASEHDLDVDMNAVDVDYRLGLIQSAVIKARQFHRLWTSSYETKEAIEENDKRFRAAHAEYAERKKKKQQKFNIEFNGGRLTVHLSNYLEYILQKEYSQRERSILKSMHGLAPSYFAFNTQDRRDLLAMVQDKTLVTMSHGALEAINKAVADAEFILTPMYPLRPQQRLGYLELIDKIKCTRSFVHRGKNGNFQFESGAEYDVNVSSTDVQVHYVKERGANGLKTEMIKTKKALLVDIGGCYFSESQEDISLMINHFDVPDPLDVKSKKPKLYQRIRKRLESEEFEKFTLLEFQIEDLSRLCMKESCVLAWEQGLGKCRGSLAWSKVRNAKKALVVCPQDLKYQWIEEAKSLGIHLEEIRGYGDVKRIKNAKSGYWIIHYELLKGSRRLDELVPEFGKAIQVEDDYDEKWNALCPRCKAMRYDGWNGRSCKKCGYHCWLRRVKGMFSYLKHAFDTVIVDEGVKIKSKHSMQGIAVRSLHAKNRLLLSGSPIKGWITDAFWLLHWTLGDGSPRFPYRYVGGTEKFLDDFGVFEYVAEEFRKSLSKGRKKLLPEIGNLPLLWKMFAPSIVRRLKIDCGETLVKKNVHRIKVGFTKDQKRVYDWWIKNFSEWFKASHHTEMEDDAVKMKEMILGLLWKLRLTATIPNSRLLQGKPAPGKEHEFFLGEAGKSPYTEKAMFVLTKVKEYVDRGKQVVVFSALQDNMNFIKQLLTRYGIRSEVANADTIPVKRSMLIADFKKKNFSVLVAGIQAVNLGHNLDNASAVIMTDYEWDHSTTRQAIDRVHRFTSKEDIDVFMLYTDGGIDQKQLFEIIDLKGQSSDLALDGKLIDQEEVQVDFYKMAREIIKSHKMGTEGLLDEDDVEQKLIEDYHVNIARRIAADPEIEGVEAIPFPSVRSGSKVVEQYQLCF
ncbi:MAG: DEAD/DEAH box helicase [bacterium]